MEDLWVDKYRPSSFEEVVGQEEAVKKLAAMAASGNVQHLLFSGPPGVGKTTCALILAHTVLGDTWSDNFMQLNASDDRKLQVIQTRVKEFARSKPINAKFKILFLDEADSLTTEAQQALRRMMEDYGENCRFIFSVNYQSEIIEPIQSRCVIVRFQALDKKDVFKLIDRIANAENLSISEDAKDALFAITRGDLRRLINLLQSLAMVNNNISAEMVYKSATRISIEKIDGIIKFALNGNFIEAKKIIDELLDLGISPYEILNALYNRISYDESVPIKKKIKLIEKIADADYRIINGATPLIQLEALIAFLSEDDRNSE